VAYVQVSTEKVDRDVRRAIAITIFAGLATALLGFCLAIYLRRFISRPVLELQRTARTVCRSNDYSVRAVKRADDELGAVVEAFNAMLDQIEQSDQALQRAHNELEHRVVERTASLASANKQLEEEIDKREHIAAELRQREAKLATVLASTVDPFLTIDANGIIQDASDSVESVLGWKPRELIGRNIKIIMPEPHRSAHDSYLETYFQTGESRLLGTWRELEAQRSDGTCFPCEVSIWRVDVPSEPEPLFTGCIRDLTERKRTEVEIESLHKQLVEAARKAGMAEIATSVLHNVGNVLTSVNVSSGLIRDKLRNSSVSELTRVVEIIQQHLDDLGTYIKQDERGRCLPQFLADLSRQMASDEQKILDEVQSLTSNIEHIKDIVAVQQTHAGISGLIEEVVLSDILEDAIRINSASAERHHVKIVRQFEEIPRVAVDKLKILQIMVNLISNAKYALMESNTANKRIVVRLSRVGDDRFRIDIEDNGVGIPGENMTRIFTHGFTTKKGGHGFGLHSAALAAEEMGCTLVAHSDGPGSGARFSLEGSCQPAGVTHV